MNRLRLTALLLAAVAVAGCGGGGGGGSSARSTSPSASTSATGTTPTTPGPVTREVALPVALARFGSYTDVPAAAPDTPRYPGPALPTSLDGVRIAPAIRTELANPRELKGTLLARGFVVNPESSFSLMHQAYEGNLYGGWPVFVTTDAGYHAWHLVFDKVLRDLEQRVLLPKLETLVTGLVQSSDAQAADLAGTPLAGDADRVKQLMTVAAAELGLPATLGPLAAKEKALIDAHATTATSPILGTKIDYSLFAPRGHYTRNASLRRYFVAMSVLGQSAFCLPGTRGCPGLQPARRAILASRVLTARPELVALWRQLYEPTAFLVGLADDYTPLELMQAVREAAPDTVNAPGSLAEDATVRSVVDRLVASRAVRISPDRASVRLMGTRFVLDSYILDQLISPYVPGRLLPSGRDVPAAFGSDFAYRTLKQDRETAYPNYDAQLASLRTAVSRRPPEAWGSTVYDAWLHALQPVFARHGVAFPAFMRGTAWTAKDLQTGLGSYAELKHDTILYAKQAVAEGDEPPPPPPPRRRNWVEPDPAAFARLVSTTNLLGAGLAERGLLSPESGALLDDTAHLFDFFARVAGDELAGRSITEADNTRLTDVGKELSSLFWRASDRTAGGVPAIDQDAAIVADIASGPPGVLEVATGRFNRIFVLVPDDSGHFQVAAGGVYAYYEFTNPPGERLNDTEWRAQLDAGTAPQRPAWEEAMFPK